MPTRRTAIILIASLIFYFFGNQIQIGWLFVISALLAGLIPTAWWYNRHILTPLTASRTLTPATDIHEGDDINITLTWHNNGRFPLAHIHTTEQCPLAPINTPERTLHLFIPSLPPQASVHLSYEVTLDRRGVHPFPPLQLHSGAPFGFFRRQRGVELPTPVLIYPEIQPLTDLQLFHSRTAAQQARPHAGRGSEVIGIRPYRPGDSPRHIHWRSVARTQQLMSKEFADEAQPGLTLLLDLYQHPYPDTDSKHTPFEWAIKIATSIVDYAHRAHYPTHLLADETALAAPTGALSWQAWLQYLARVQPTGHYPLTHFGQQAVQTFVAAILPWPDPAYQATLIDLHHRTTLMVVLLDPATFPIAGPTAQPFANALQANALNVKLIQYGTDWREGLS